MIETKLINTIEEDLSNGIFITIYNKHIFDWLSQNDAQNLDIEYYYNRSGEKYISPLFDKLIKSSNYIDKLYNNFEISDRVYCILNDMVVESF